MITSESVSSHLVPEGDRLAFVDRLYGLDFPLRLEGAIYDWAGELSADYDGNFWEFYALSNGGAYFAPRSEKTFAVQSPNGYQAQLTADALGIVACLFAFSNLAFGKDSLAARSAESFHKLRDFAVGHPEVSAILAVCD